MPRQELGIVLVVALVQFINIVDFMMVTPLGPFFADSLHIAKSDLGLVAAFYTLSAGAAGIAGSFFLDRFDRRPALAVCMLGLVCGTFLGGFAHGLHSLLAARLVAGMFGGPATSLSMSIIADVVPVVRRGRAMALVMTAFSASSVLGVPLSLEAAERGGWKMPFFGLAALGVVVNIAGFLLLPPLRGHLAIAHKGPVWGELKSLVGRSTVRWSWLMTGIVMMAGFAIIPNLPAYLVSNLSYPETRLKVLYLAGGLASIATLQVAGRLVDRYGSFKVVLFASAALIAQLYFYVVKFIPGTPVMAMFVLFMILMNFRNVAYNTLTSRVPAPFERARFMSIQSAVQHGSSALGGIFSAWILAEAPDGSLLHMDWVAYLSIALTATVPFMVSSVERRVGDRPKQPLPLSGPTPLAGPAGPPVNPDHL